MDITYLGHSSFKIRGKLATVVTDPFDSKTVGFKYPSVEADIVTISHDHADHNRADLVKGVKKIVTGPGEYEILGVSIIGISQFHDEEKGQKRGRNTLYVFEVDGVRAAHLGDLGHELSDEVVNQIGDIDVLMIPTGGFFTIGAKEAVEIVTKIEPYYVIPMHYKVEGINLDTFSELSPVEEFLTSSGLSVEKLSKFSIKKDEVIEDQGTKVILLERKT